MAGSDVRRFEREDGVEIRESGHFAMQQKTPPIYSRTFLTHWQREACFLTFVRDSLPTHHMPQQARRYDADHWAPNGTRR